MIYRPRVVLPASRRRGITLIEFLVVVTAVASMLGLSAVTIQVLLRLNVDGQSRVTSSLAVERLARQFRTDVHGSDRAELASDPQARSTPANLRLTYDPDRVIAYSADDHTGTVVRTESRAGKRTTHESYALGHSHAARFELRAEPRRPWAVLVMTQVGISKAEPPRPLEVIALQGKDRAHQIRQAGGRAAMIRKNRGKPRRGMTVIAVLICLIVVTLLGAALIRVALVQREVVRAHEQRLQAEWLAESGALRRARAARGRRRVQRRNLVRQG